MEWPGAITYDFLHPKGEQESYILTNKNQVVNSIKLSKNERTIRPI
jgi:hypothetical protein